MRRADRLKVLIASQARDMADDRRGRRRGGGRELTGGMDLDAYSAPPIRAAWLLVGMDRPWGPAEVERARSEKGPCPNCAGVELRGPEYCPACDACGLDGKVSYPGIPVGRMIDYDWPVDRPGYTPARLARLTRAERRRAADQARSVQRARSELAMAAAVLGRVGA